MAGVLVISADRTRGLFLSRILESAGHTIQLVTGTAGSEMIPQSDVNAVLVDLDLPNAEPLSEVVTLRRRLPHVAIIAVTTAEQPIDFLQLRMSGANDVLKYPFSPPSLLEAVQRAIEETP